MMKKNTVDGTRNVGFPRHFVDSKFGNFVLLIFIYIIYNIFSSQKKNIIYFSFGKQMYLDIF
jgi:hypothetical protein